MVQPYRARRTLALVALAAAALILGVAAPAAAHSSLISTSPEQGSQVGDLPRSVTLHFSEGVAVNSRSVEVLDPDGQRIDAGDPHHRAGDDTTVVVDLGPRVEHVSYAVVWHVVSADSHPVSGTFSFGVGVPAGLPPHASVDHLVAGLHAVFRFAALLAAMLLLGGVFFLVVLWPAGAQVESLRRMLAFGWALSLVSALALIQLQGPFGAGLGLGAMSDPELGSVTLSGTFGKALVARIVLLAVAVAVWRRHAPTAGVGRPQLGAARRAAAGLGVLFVITFSVAEHAGQGSWVPLSVTVDAVHLTAACIWLGGLAVLGIAGLRGIGADASVASVTPTVTVLSRWSGVAMGCVLALAVTGTYQAWREVGSFAGFTATTYGRLLLYKIAAFVVLIVLGDQGRRWVRRSAVEKTVREAGPSHPSTRGLRRAVLVELLIGAFVLGVTATLVNTVPARQSYAPPLNATVQALSADGTAMTVVLDVDPTRVGRERVHLYTYTPKGVPQRFQSATGTLTPDTSRPGPVSAGSDRLGPVRFTFVDGGPGHGEADQVVLPSSGTWTLTVQIYTDATTAFSASTRYEVH